MTYEEGGSNGLGGERQLSSVALILTCTTTDVDPIEAWCMPIESEDEPFCVSPDTLGAALLCTESMTLSEESFDPLLVLTRMKSNGISIELYALSHNPMKAESMNIHEFLEISYEIFEAPTMAMGSSPPVLCLCWKKNVVIIVRDRGLLVTYEYDNHILSFSFKHEFGRYVVDAGIQTSETANTKICALVSERNKKDGRIVKIDLE